jgi:diguanylate cyclase (GGDEF)-like protein
MKKKKIHILLVEDNPGDARLMVELITDFGEGEYKVQHADRVSSAQKYLCDQRFDVVLLDLSLPDERGIGIVDRICSACLHVPVIVFTDQEDDELALTAVQAGAQDYLVKGQVDGAGIARAIHYAIERKRLEEHLQFLANHDALTELPNRRLFQDRMEQAIERAHRNVKKNDEKGGMAVLLLDLDNFKIINDTLGHAQGDLLLCAVAVRLMRNIRKSDTLARMGGDEFTLICENLVGRGDAEILARKIQAVFLKPFQIRNHRLAITASMGISLFPSDGKDTETLLRQADIAMYRAKRQRNRYWFYEMCKAE